ncbi:MAG: acetyl-CoA carboxylase, biotin carboxyl carrier protein [Bacteroidetes bacterium MedPE-SWsnd-G1]|nr:MAG: acetyl-CoA carboxylase, biotin carboxyl carrier protein [Bacteroidetes bacterium MedPE-SWsnd-G1]
MELKDIQNLIKFVSKSGVNEVKLEREDFKITIKAGSSAPETTIVHQAPMMAQAAPMAVAPTAPPAAAPAAAPADAAPAAGSDDSKYIEIKSPIIGTFYRRPSPDKPNFVEVGDTVQADTVVCIVEAMKLFNEIESEVSGKIVKVLVDESSPVEFGQPLFLVDPS